MFHVPKNTQNSDIERSLTGNLLLEIEIICFIMLKLKIYASINATIAKFCAILLVLPAFKKTNKKLDSF